MKTKGYHPIFKSNPTCGLDYALKLSNEGQNIDTEKILLKIKNYQDINNFKTTEKKVFFRNLLHLRINRINRKVAGLNNKM